MYKRQVCCIPTSAGTGSEATRAALIKDTVHKKKYSVRDMNGRLVPDVAILDPSFTVSMPKSLTAASGMDALTHAIESYVTPTANPFAREMCIRDRLRRAKTFVEECKWELDKQDIPYAVSYTHLQL